MHLNILLACLAKGGGVHPQLVPYDILTDRERRKNREHAQELLRFLQFLGFRISRCVPIARSTS